MIYLSIVIIALLATVIYLLVRLLKDEKTVAEVKQCCILAESQRDMLKSQYSDELSRMQSQHTAEVERLKSQYNEELERMHKQQEAEIARMKNEEEQRQRLAEDRFKTLATNILDENTRKLRDQNAERLTEILAPLKENINNFRETFDRTYTEEARERFSLEQRIKELIEVNDTIGREARELSTALRKGTGTQGHWGEMVLESILEKSGLKKGEQFIVQETKDAEGNTLQNETGRGLRADVVVYYPDGRCIVIDSKVSLNDYVDMINATDPKEAEVCAKKHVAAVRENMRILAGKNYCDYIGEKKADFVMMFIPNEGAYMAAMNADSNLWQDAYDKRVLIISPTHLISALRLIGQLWRQDDMSRHVLAIAEEGGKMYDKFVGFVEDMLAIEKSLAATRTTYESAMNKLTTGNGNLVRKAENMRMLGAKAKKTLPRNITEQNLDSPADTE